MLIMILSISLHGARSSEPECEYNVDLLRHWEMFSAPTSVVFVFGGHASHFIEFVKFWYVPIGHFSHLPFFLAKLPFGQPT
jgi:hypothetical protein